MLRTELHLDCNIKEEHRYNNKGNTHTNKNFCFMVKEANSFLMSVEKYEDILCTLQKKWFTYNHGTFFYSAYKTFLLATINTKFDKLLKSSLGTHYWIERSKCIQFPNAHTKLLYE